MPTSRDTNSIKQVRRKQNKSSRDYNSPSSIRLALALFQQMTVFPLQPPASADPHLSFNAIAGAEPVTSLTQS